MPSDHSNEEPFKAPFTVRSRQTTRPTYEIRDRDKKHVADGGEEEMQWLCTRLNAASQAAMEGEREAFEVWFARECHVNADFDKDDMFAAWQARATQSAPQPAPDGLAAEFDAEVREMVTRLCPDESHGPVCSFCGRDPYHYVDNGVGMERVAVECCDLGIALYQHGDELLAKEVALKREAAALLTRLLSAPQPVSPVAGDWVMVPRARILAIAAFAEMFGPSTNLAQREALADTAINLRALLSAPADGWEKKAAEIDEIMTRIYRRFKDWSQRKFSADDVTWCEVRADILEILQRHNPPQRLSGEEASNVENARYWVKTNKEPTGNDIRRLLAIIDRLAPQDGKGAEG